MANLGSGDPVDDPLGGFDHIAAPVSGEIGGQGFLERRRLTGRERLGPVEIDIGQPGGQLRLGPAEAGAGENSHPGLFEQPLTQRGTVSDTSLGKFVGVPREIKKEIEAPSGRGV